MNVPQAILKGVMQPVFSYAQQFHGTWISAFLSFMVNCKLMLFSSFSRRFRLLSGNSAPPFPCPIPHPILSDLDIDSIATFELRYDLPPLTQKYHIPLSLLSFGISPVFLSSLKYVFVYAVSSPSFGPPFCKNRFNSNASSHGLDEIVE